MQLTSIPHKIICSVTAAIWAEMILRALRGVLSREMASSAVNSPTVSHADTMEIVLHRPVSAPWSRWAECRCPTTHSQTESGSTATSDRWWCWTTCCGSRRDSRCSGLRRRIAVSGTSSHSLFTAWHIHIKNSINLTGWVAWRFWTRSYDQLRRLEEFNFKEVKFLLAGSDDLRVKIRKGAQNSSSQSSKHNYLTQL